MTVILERRIFGKEADFSTSLNMAPVLRANGFTLTLEPEPEKWHTTDGWNTCFQGTVSLQSEFARDAQVAGEGGLFPF
jgi:hypothetical protein